MEAVNLATIESLHHEIAAARADAVRRATNYTHRNAGTSGATAVVARRLAGSFAESTRALCAEMVRTEKRIYNMGDRASMSHCGGAALSMLGIAMAYLAVAVWELHDGDHADAADSVAAAREWLGWARAATERAEAAEAAARVAA